MTVPAPTRWHRVEDGDLPAEGRGRSVEVGGRSIATARCGDRLGALENHCPHQGGPLGEGSIEKGLLRCPWHGYDDDPNTGRPPGRSVVPSPPSLPRPARPCCASNRTHNSCSHQHFPGNPDLTAQPHEKWTMT